jgi:hypothetical protein
MMPPTPPEYLATLYCHAFRDFGETALHGLTPIPDPKPSHALAVVHCLRNYGDSRAWQLANELQAAREAVLQSRVSV